MRLVFISLVTAMTPLRTISVTTGSALRFFPTLPRLRGRAREGAPALRGAALVFFFAMSSPASCDRDHEISVDVDLEPVARQQHRRRCVLLDQRGAIDPV